MGNGNFSSPPNGRTVRADHPSIGAYEAFVPNPLPESLDLPIETILRLSEADRAIGELSGEGRRLPNPGLLINPLLRREAVLSSRIEGTETTVAGLYAFEVGQLSFLEPEDRERRSDLQEVQNYVRALHFGISEVERRQVSLSLIQDLHRILLQGTRGEARGTGVFRSEPVWIGPEGCTIEEATYVPPPPMLLTDLLRDLEHHLESNLERVSLPPLIRLALVHYQFEAIHPFYDGNGRIGRLLIALLLARWNLLSEPLLYLSAYLERYRPTYYHLLQRVSDGSEWIEWVHFILEGVIEQARDTVRRINRFQELHNSYRELAHSQSASTAPARIVDLLFEFPLVNTSIVVERLGLSRHTARNNLLRLEKLGILQRTSSSHDRRVQWYLAAEILNAIE